MLATLLVFHEVGQGAQGQQRRIIGKCISVWRRFEETENLSQSLEASQLGQTDPGLEGANQGLLVGGTKFVLNQAINSEILIGDQLHSFIFQFHVCNVSHDGSVYIRFFDILVTVFAQDLHAS